MSKTQSKKILQNYADYITETAPDFKYFGSNQGIVDLARGLNQHGHNSILLTGPAGIGRRSLISGFVQGLSADFMPIEMMNLNVKRLNVQELFNTQNIATVEERFDEVIEELKSAKASTGKKPVLVIDDGSCFAKEVTERRASSLLNKLKDADIGSDDFDLILSLDTDAMHLMKKSYPNFLAHFTEQKIDTMADSDVTAMLEHESKRYARYQLDISEDAIAKVVQLCKRYAALGHFSMPKNASVFLDEVATAFRMKYHSKPQGAVEQEAELATLEGKLKTADESEKSALESQIEQIKANLQVDYDQWTAAKASVLEIRSEIQKYEETKAKQQERLDRCIEIFEEKSAEEYERLKGENSDRVKDKSLKQFMQTDTQNKQSNMPGDAAKIKTTIEGTDDWIKKDNVKLQAAIDEMLFPITLDADFVQDYAQNKLGMNDVPDLRKLIRTADQKINSIVMGQEQMITPMISAIKQRLGRKSEANKPKGAFLILGPSGVGKTYIAEIISEVLCGGKLSVVNMEGFKEKHTVSRMIGAPPGYAGYDEKAELIKINEANPSGVILLDEIEKAHLDVKQAFLTPLDKGKFTSANGKDTADFRDNIVIMTSNFGQQDIILPNADEPFEVWEAQIKDKIYKAADHFSPEFLNRCTILCADFLSPEVIEKVVTRRVNAFAKEFVGEDGDFKVEIDEESAKRVVADHYHKKNGARVVQTMLEQNIGDYVCNLVLDNDADEKNTCGVLKVCYNDGKFTYDLTEAAQTLTADNENKPSASNAFAPNAAVV
ncbi:MAG: AAA family ATPase [Alphaproteobacteria bacterium]|nr:AAA family ATPase [Alphaproteobacteria bacterium]